MKHQKIERFAGVIASLSGKNLFPVVHLFRTLLHAYEISVSQICCASGTFSLHATPLPLYIDPHVSSRFQCPLHGFHFELFIVGQIRLHLFFLIGISSLIALVIVTDSRCLILGITMMEGSGSRFMAAVVVRFPKFGAPPQLLPRLMQGLGRCFRACVVVVILLSAVF